MTLRRAVPGDAATIADVHLTAMRVSLPFLPELHTLEEACGYFSETVLPGNEVWVAEEGGQVVGYVAYDPAWINHLYIHPDHQGRGLGPALLGKAMSDGRPKQLWTFQKNTRARAFYESRGFRPVRFTDGAGNEEREPDVLYAWTPA